MCPLNVIMRLETIQFIFKLEKKLKQNICCTYSFARKSHKYALLSNEPVNSTFPFLWKWTEITSPLCSANVCSDWPVSTWNIFAVRSMDAVAKRSQSIGLNSVPTISARCPKYVCKHLPFTAFHNLTVLSNEAVVILSLKFLRWLNKRYFDAMSILTTLDNCIQRKRQRFDVLAVHVIHRPFQYPIFEPFDHSFPSHICIWIIKVKTVENKWRVRRI